MDRNITVTIGGNIACGKSTLMTTLTDTARISQQMQKNWKIIPEPVDKWGNWLNLFYKDMNKYAFGFQMKVMYEYLFVKTANKNVITERSPMDSVYIFARLLLLKGVLNNDEMELLKDFNKEIGWKPDVYVYIRSDPNICFNRIKERNRECESDVSLEYLTELNNVYEEFIETLSNVPIDMKLFIVDGNKDRNEVFSDVLEIMANVDQL